MFQVDTPINAKVTAVQSFENLHTFILRQPCWWARERPQSIFSYNIIENSVQRHILWSYMPYQNLGQIDHNLHNHVFDDVICTNFEAFTIFTRIRCTIKTSQ